VSPIAFKLIIFSSLNLPKNIKQQAKFHTDTWKFLLKQYCGWYAIVSWFRL